MLKMALIPLFVLFFLITHSVLPSSAQEEVEFPFSNMMNTECGVLKVKCSEDGRRIQLKPEGHWYRIENISWPHSIVSIVVKDKAEPEDLLDHCKLMNEYSLPSPTDDSSLFSSDKFTAENSSTLYKCSHKHRHKLGATRKDLYPTECGDYDFYCILPNMSFPYYKPQCQNITLPFSLPPLFHHDHPLLINVTFRLNISLECHNILPNQFQCASPSPKVVSGLSKQQKLGLAVAFGQIGILVIMLIYCFRKKHNHDHQSIEAFLKNCGPLQIRRYSYSNIKKMTNSFKEKLGQGGFGSVYKGKLHDGHFVAVKMLNELKANDGEDFINEVAAISRTSHVNVVRLLGFCFEGAKKALIYEFMPNGSLEKFVYDEDETKESYQLDWETYYQISLGTARGLEYLHRGCNRRILHFDIKPHNILLDADFVPKISDFGLAKICTRKDSLVSMLGPRGTIGYIAPEVFSRYFGGVSHKSDVYSYGMMVLEMVGGRKNINNRVDNISELYFLQWIYERLELKELGLKRIISEEDNVKSRKMIMTSLWCIQTNPSSRPTMSRVIEMLEGSPDSLKVPPKPFLSSPPRSSPSHSSNTLVSLQV
ncbi:LEAF RUST 10 DISEASE-RESISTANCE LOCUS RECEPTOR-LIKE PROTEIN KINASE-like 2.4 [Humulus lupulus]|uniref:LEAF RUST 10 DISEASE-RESISTANCE LOCUS RECEPTOR-LIKE PROTEIN KINASE-like 2.4 n=1 Tax=Humulus lupulus TaxID=3486 RepID=UPI002B41085D|nr:LEAF RUST 10 DISEASE-RESISTANCE LOCUS RECEPTOR-LIKE PROTEIN KINASE-like 2.4 [Humulus lupulus]